MLWSCLLGIDPKNRLSVQLDILDKCKISFHNESRRSSIKYVFSTGDALRDKTLERKFVCANAFGNVYCFTRKQRQNLLKRMTNKGYVLGCKCNSTSVCVVNLFAIMYYKLYFSRGDGSVTCMKFDDWYNHGDLHVSEGGSFYVEKIECYHQNHYCFVYIIRKLSHLQHRPRKSQTSWRWRK